jgi:hypothetical protein
MFRDLLSAPPEGFTVYYGWLSSLGDFYSEYRTCRYPKTVVIKHIFELKGQCHEIFCFWFFS